MIFFIFSALATCRLFTGYGRAKKAWRKGIHTGEGHLLEKVVRHRGNYLLGGAETLPVFKQTDQKSNAMGSSIAKARGCITIHFSRRCSCVQKLSRLPTRTTKKVAAMRALLLFVLGRKPNCLSARAGTRTKQALAPGSSAALYACRGAGANRLQYSCRAKRPRARRTAQPLRRASLEDCTDSAA